MRHVWFAGPVLMGAMLLAGCGNDGVTGTGEDTGPTSNATPVTVSGAAFKGPLVLGSPIVAERLDKNAASTGEVHVTKTTDDLGSFSVTFSDAGFAKMFATGYHFNEYSGALDGPITLNGIVDATSSTNVKAYVNVLTHLVFDRELNLIESGLSGQQAILQAQSELVAAFSSFLPTPTVPDFSAATLFDGGASSSYANAYLLALSAALEKYAPNAGELTQVLNKLAVDLADNGLIDTPNLVNDLGTACRSLDPQAIRDHLQQYAEKNGLPDVIVADISIFVDTDGDGIVNSEDPDDDNDNIPDTVDPNPTESYVTQLSLRVDLGIIEMSPNLHDLGYAAKVDYFVEGTYLGTGTDETWFSIDWSTYFWSGVEYGGDTEITITSRIYDSAGLMLEGPSFRGTIPPIYPSIITPYAGQVVTDTNTPTLSWMLGSREIDTISQSEIQLWADGEPVNLLLATTIDVTSIVTPALPAGTYWWRLRMANSDGKWGPWTGPLLFYISTGG